MKIVIAAAAGAFVLAAHAATAEPPSRQDFIINAIKGDNSEIMLGRLAARSGKASGVRQYGRTLVADHRLAKSQAIPVAQRLGVTPPTGAMMKARAEYAKLQVLSGRSFDREFAGYMIRDHQQDISDFREEAAMHRGPTSHLAREQLPTLRKHLEIAQSLEDRVR